MEHLKSLAFIAALLLFATVNLQAQDTTRQHPEHLSNMREHYMVMKDALAQDNFEAARSSLVELKKEVAGNSEMNNHEKHMRHHKLMIEAVEKGVNAENIDVLRAAFADITTHLAKALKKHGYDAQTLYLQYCPMAVNGEGAHWINEQKEIVNPYLGQKMLDCGKVEKTINPNQ